MCQKLIFSHFTQAMDRTTFSCGDNALDEYIKKQASQDIKRNFATVIVASSQDMPEFILGYYTLSTASVALDSLPVNISRKMPRYQSVPSVRLGRLAVSFHYQKQHIGSLLVFDAMKRSCKSELAWAVFIIDAKHEKAARFYEKFLFQRLPDRDLTLWMHRKQVEALIL